MVISKPNVSFPLCESNAVVECKGGCCYPKIVIHIAEALTIMTAVLGVLGNGLTVAVIVGSSLRRNINCVLIGNLSIADLLFMCVVLPFHAMAFYHCSWPLPDWVCILVASIRVWLDGVIMCLLSAIAFYRCLIVVYPLTHKRITKRKFIVCCSTASWLLPASFSLMAATEIWGCFAFQERILQCTFSSHVAHRSYKFTTLLLSYVGPCVFICFCYTRISFLVYNSRKRSLAVRRNSTNFNLRLTTMMMMIFLSFFIGTMPYVIVNLLDNEERSPMAHMCALLLGWLCYCLNPVIYTVMDRNFAHAYKNCISCLPWRGETPEIITAREQFLLMRGTSIPVDVDEILFQSQVDEILLQSQVDEILLQSEEMVVLKRGSEPYSSNSARPNIRISRSY